MQMSESKKSYLIIGKRRGSQEVLEAAARELPEPLTMFAVGTVDTLVNRPREAQSNGHHSLLN